MEQDAIAIRRCYPNTDCTTRLGILIALCIEMGAVIPPVGLNLFAVSGTTGVPVTTVMRGSFPFLITDGCVLVLCLLIPALVLWLPNLVVQSVFG